MKNKDKAKQLKRSRRVARVRAKIFGTLALPRLAVFRSLKHMSAQLIDDENQKTLVAATDHELKNMKKKTNTEIAEAVGTLLAEKALQKNISVVVFDRRSYAYQGRVKALASGARTGGLKF